MSSNALRKQLEMLAFHNTDDVIPLLLYLIYSCSENKISFLSSLDIGICTGLRSDISNLLQLEDERAKMMRYIKIYLGAQQRLIELINGLPINQLLWFEGLECVRFICDDRGCRSI